MTDLNGVAGFHNVSKTEAREIITEYIKTDGYFLLRPPQDSKGGVIGTICVTNRQKVMNYRLVKDTYNGSFYVHSHTPFSNIADLLSYYYKVPLNPDHNTRLLHPVVAEQEEAYVALEPAIIQPEPEPVAPKPVTKKQSQPSQEDISQLAGVHMNLSKSEVSNLMLNYVNQEGAYLVRPSVSSQGLFTISVICNGSTLNFKINKDANDGQYFVTPRRKYFSVRELLETHRTSPLKSKAKPGAKIYLLYPIQAVPSSPLSNALPAPWQEFFDEGYKRPYYYNPETRQTVWTRPKAEAPPLPPGGNRTTRSKTMNNRPLPVPNEIEKSGSRSASLTVSSSPKTGRHQTMSTRPLPTLPPKNNTSVSGPPPVLPPKDSSPGPPPLRQTNRPPPLPSKNDQPSLPPPSQPNQRHPAARSERPLPTLPPKNDTRGPPPLPVKDDPSLPSLPPKAMPPLPPKDDKPLPVPPGMSNNVSTAPPSSGKMKMKRPTEYEDMPVPRLPSKTPSDSSSSVPQAPPPPLVVAPPPQGGGGAVPPPPPIPSGGIPAPPPPPPCLPPPSPLPERATTQQKKSPAPARQESAEGGRPFTANDLLAGKSLLKKRTEPINPPKKNTGGMGNLLSNAIDLRLTSIRSAVGSDEESDCEEADEWDDDDF